MDYDKLRNTKPEEWPCDGLRNGWEEHQKWMDAQFAAGMGRNMFAEHGIDPAPKPRPSLWQRIKTALRRINPLNP